MEYGGQLPDSDDLDMQNFQAAYEIIRFMDEMPGGFLIYRADGDEEIIYANRALQRIFQCDTLQEFMELTGHSFKGLVYPEDLEAVEQSIWEQIAASQHDLDYVEYRITRKDGIVRWIEDYGHFVHTEGSGDIFYVFLSDGTEKRERQMEERAKLLWDKKQKEQKIRQLTEEYDKERKLINQEYLRRLEVIEGLSMNYETILYADLDADQVLPYRLSSRTESQFGKKFQPCSYDWFISDYIQTWVYPEDQELVSGSISPRYIRKHLEKQNAFYINYRVLCDGEARFIQLRIVNVGNQAHISQIVLGSRMVDEEIRQELEQKAVLEEALHNANLAIRAKNTFLSNMSHDMRTPLNAMFGYTELAQKYIDDRERVSRYLKEIDFSGRRLLDLIEKVLEISWTEANDVHITETECNLIDMVQDIQNTVLPQAVNKSIQFDLDISGLKHPDVFADQDKLRQAILYLADNAVEYTQNGGRVSLGVMEAEPWNDYAEYQFIVADNGIGIGEDFLEHIFEPFEREKNTTFSGIYGIGLGLTITKHYIDIMGGSIDVDSTIDQGSTFTVTLQLRIQEQPLSSEVNAENMVSR
ncbi:MAG: PAS domain-containing sensor histidine kinase, partial [Lachnospiraceae bacterium]|nr:PAS domain-containing sensor histidine kinase [Lachnospiraceae bacterium]